MSKYSKIATIVTVLAVMALFVGATAAFAQGPNRSDDFTPPGVNQARHGAGEGMGLLAVDEATMHTAIAEALNLSLEEFEAALADGKTPAILAQELGVDFADVWAAMNAVHEAALQQAVDDGLITQEQADWILAHRGGQNGRGNGLNRGMGNGPAGGLGRGPGARGGNGNYGGDCPYQTP